MAVPALSLRFVPHIEWNFNTLILFVGPFIVMAGGYVFVKIYASFAKINLRTQTALFVACALGNTGFIGIPLVSAYFGEENVSSAVIFDQMTFVLFSSLAVVAVLRASAPADIKHLHFTILLKVLKFPPFIAFVTALTLPHFVNISYFDPLFDKLSATMSPLALFSVGMQLKLSDMKNELKHLVAGLSYKLVIAPLLVLIYALVTGSTGMYTKISIFEAAMSSQITASLMANQYNLNPQLSTLIVSIGIIASFFTTFIWWLMVNLIF